MDTRIKNFALLNLGTLLITVGVYFFKFPNNFSTGGVTGIAVVMGKLTPNITPGTYNMVLNIVLLALGLLFMGKSFGMLTAYSSMTMAAAISILEKFYPMPRPFTDQPLLELIFGVKIGRASCRERV